MSIDLDRVIRALRSQLEAFRALYRGVNAEEASWRPESGGWSLLEILGHIADEEREDFRRRIDYTLHRPDEEWPPIDPVAWVTERDYAGRELADVWADFEEQRKRSLAWLAELDNPDWAAQRTHPVAGPLRAGDLMASWEAHDLLHLRQISHRRHQYISANSGPYSSRYAGDW